MRAKSSPLLCAAALALAWATAAGAQNFDIRIELKLGESGALWPGPAVGPGDSVAAVYPIQALAHPLRIDDAPGQSAREINRDLVSIYGLDRVYSMAGTTLPWTPAHSGFVPSVFLLERETFRIDVEPRFVRPKRMKLRLVVSRALNKAGDLERLLDTDLVASLDDPVVAGFSHAGQPYFVSVLVTRAPSEAGAPAGAPGPGPVRQATSVPLPVRRVEPRLPDSVDPALLNGEVVLRVTIDDQGKVRDIKVLKSLQPDVDRETVKAVGEWEFEPAPGGAGRDGKTFVISIRFPRAGKGER
jgi:TonB family protein